MLLIIFLIKEGYHILDLQGREFYSSLSSWCRSQATDLFYISKKHLLLLCFVSTDCRSRANADAGLEMGKVKGREK
jgi:hypothetical protein